MKNYKITVNGNVYDVTVEETTGTAVSAQAAVSAPVKTAAAAPAPAPKKEAAKGPEGSVKVTAPMPGKILGVKASAGQTVKRGDVLIILEAMKMENEIVAPSDGTIASIQAAVGDSVEAGATLATLN
nr:biotin/lipoyl-containing protein [uncultured Clostridium sp.]